MKQRIKTFDELTIHDDFLFCIIMRDPAYCKPFLERILNIAIQKISYPQSQKTIDLTADAKSIRLDIYVEDDTHTLYNVEMQTTPNRNLPKRTRYYQDLIDLDHLNKGDDYEELRPSFIIFICLFDLFGEDRYVYTFENRCLESAYLGLNDQTQKIFINTKGKKGPIQDNLKALLQYIDTGTVSDPYTQNLEEAVKLAKSNQKWRRDYMTFSLKLKEEFSQGRKEGFREGREEGLRAGHAEGRQEGIKEGRQEGRQEGLKEGLKEGREKGIQEGILRTLMSLVSDGLLKEEDAAARLNLTVNEFRKQIL